MIKNIHKPWLCLLPLAGITAGSSIEALAADAAPNIIYILADDLGYSDLSCYGQAKFRTPNIDSLCSQGLKFTNHYSGCTVSAPSRCSLMTGLHTGHTPIRGNAGEYVGGLEFDTSLPASYVTIAECLKEKNYATACVGKWGMGGPGRPGHPNNQGFDYFYGHLGQGHAHFSYPQFLYENQTQVVLNKSTYAQDLFLEKASNFITANKDKPFFLFFSVTIPHAELVVPEEYATPFVGTFDDQPWPSNGHYGYTPHKHASFAGMISRLDGDVGKIRKLLEDLGIDKNTLIIFTSDNGPHAEGGADPDFFKVTGGLKGIKRDLYEGGVRVPMIAYWPQTIARDRTSDHISAFWDVLPTFCDLSGATTPTGLDGISFKPELLGDVQTKKHEYIYFEFHETPSQSVRKGNWKAIRKNVKTTPVMELYDLSVDPTESNNIAAQYPAIVAEMKNIMIGARTNDTQWTFPEETIVEPPVDAEIERGVEFYIENGCMPKQNNGIERTGLLVTDADAAGTNITVDIWNIIQNRNKQIWTVTSEGYIVNKASGRKIGMGSNSKYTTNDTGAKFTFGTLSTPEGYVTITCEGQSDNKFSAYNSGNGWNIFDQSKPAFEGDAGYEGSPRAWKFIPVAEYEQRPYPFLSKDGEAERWYLIANCTKAGKVLSTTGTSGLELTEGDAQNTLESQLWKVVAASGDNKVYVINKETGRYISKSGSSAVVMQAGAPAVPLTIKGVRNNELSLTWRDSDGRTSVVAHAATNVIQQGEPYYKTEGTTWRFVPVGDPTNISQVITAGNISVYINDRYVRLEGGRPFELYHLNGMLIPSDRQLSPGVYVVKVDHQAIKIYIR